MSDSLPHAKSSRSLDRREKLQRLISERSLGGLANDTKWDELIDAMRAREGWRPIYRCKCIDGLPSTWDSEWFYHLPLPMLSVEWFDIGYLQEVHVHRAPPRTDIIDHAEWIEELLRTVGLDYQKGHKMFRIFGYTPRNLELFDE